MGLPPPSANLNIHSHRNTMTDSSQTTSLDREQMDEEFVHDGDQEIKDRDLALAKWVVDLEESEEFIKAKKLVQKHANALSDLKRAYQRRGIKKLKWKKQSTIYQLEFKIREQEAVSLRLMPDEIKDKYRDIRQIWLKHISIVKS